MINYQIINTRDLLLQGISPRTVVPFVASNMLANSDWQINNGQANAAALYKWNTDNANISGTVVFGRNYPNGWNPGRGGSYDYDSGDIGTSHYSEIYQLVPVQPGKSYEFSVFANVLYCRVSLFLYWYDSNGSYVGFVPLLDYDPGGVVTQPTTISAMKFLWNTATAPSNATQAGFQLRKTSTSLGYTTSFVFWNHAMMTVARPGVTQDTASPWVESGVDTYPGGGLDPLSVNGPQIGNGAVSTTQLGGSAATDILSVKASVLAITFNVSGYTYAIGISYLASVSCSVLVTFSGLIRVSSTAGGGGPFYDLGTDALIYEYNFGQSSQVINYNSSTLSTIGTAIAQTGRFDVVAGATYVFYYLFRSYNNASYLELNALELRIEVIKR
jgi:hypothetical protein